MPQLPDENPARLLLRERSHLIAGRLHLDCIEQLAFVATVVGARGAHRLQLATLRADASADASEQRCVASRLSSVANRSTQHGVVAPQALWRPVPPPTPSLAFRRAEELAHRLRAALPSPLALIADWLAIEWLWHVLLALLVLARILVSV